MASTTSSCPIGIDDEEIDLSNDELSDDKLDLDMDMDMDTKGIRCAGSRGVSHSRGGRPPISSKKRLRN
jgi:hypothetical protein